MTSPTDLPVGSGQTPASKPVVEKKRIQVPLVQTNYPGTVPLTGERIAEILDEEDASPRD